LSGASPAVDDEHDTDSTSSQLPWKVVLHFTGFPSDILIPLDEAGKIHHDAFINSVKEADFLRNGSAKAIMSLSKDDSTTLWKSVQQHDMTLFNSINQNLLNPPPGMELRHVPLKIYLPNATSPNNNTGEQPLGTLKIVQGLAKPYNETGALQTLGGTLHDLLPTVFPSRRSYIFAQAVLHGAVLPLSAPVKDLMHSAAYCDGFLHIAVVMVR